MALVEETKEGLERKTRVEGTKVIIKNLVIDDPSCLRHEFQVYRISHLEQCHADILCIYSGAKSGIIIEDRVD